MTFQEYNKSIIPTCDGRVLVKPRSLINKILIYVYLFNTIFIPYDNFGFKKLSFILLVVLNIDVVIKELSQKNNGYTVLLFSIVLPLYTIFNSVVITGNVIGNFLSGYTGMILLLYCVIKRFKIDFIRPFIYLLIILALFMDISAIIDLIGFQSVYANPILQWMHKTSNGNIGKGARYVLGYYLFIKTSPMLLIALGYLMQKKRYFISVAVLFALILSGTRANAALGVLTFGICIFLVEKNKFKRIVMILVISSFLGYILFGQDLLAKFLSYFVSKAGSDEIRSLTLPSIFATWSKRPLSFISGQGYSSEFFNMGRMAWSSDCELSYWNLLRRVGVFCFILFMYCYAEPIIRLSKKRVAFAVTFSYIAYLAGCYVNPLLYTSTGVTVLLFMYVFVWENVYSKKTV